MFRRFADTQKARVWANNLKYEWLKLENTVNCKKWLFYYLKKFIEFILESPTFLGGSRNRCEAIQPGKTSLFDKQYAVFVWELVSYWPIFSILALKPVHFSHFNFQCFLLFLGRYFLYHDHCAVCCSYNFHKNPRVSVRGVVSLG